MLLKRIHIKNSNIRIVGMAIGNFDGIHLGHRFIINELKKLKLTDKIDLALLKKLNIVKKKYKKLKVLGKGDIKEKLIIEVNFLSSSAKAKLEKSGSNIKIINK